MFSPWEYTNIKSSNQEKREFEPVHIYARFIKRNKQRSLNIGQKYYYQGMWENQK